MVESMSSTKDDYVSDVCEACVMGKQHRVPYSKKSLNKEIELFEIVHRYSGNLSILLHSLMNIRDVCKCISLRAKRKCWRSSWNI